MLPLAARRTLPLAVNQAQKYTHTKADALAKETIRTQSSRKHKHITDSTQAPQTRGRMPNVSRAPTTFFDTNHQPIITPCPSPPDIPSTKIPQWLWNYKQNMANSLSKVDASNTIFRYDHVILDILGWQLLRKHKRTSQEKEAKHYKVQWHPVTIEKWALPIFKNDRLHPASTKHVPRRTKSKPVLPALLEPCEQRTHSNFRDL